MYKTPTQTINPKRLFFSLAVLWAALAPLLFVLSMNFNFIIGIHVIEHGRGMLFGFTSALVTGFLVGSRSVYEVRWLLFLWCTTRVIELLTQQLTLCHWLYLIYGVHLAVIIIPKFSRSKNIRNGAMSPVLGMLLLFPVLAYLEGTKSNPRDWMFVFVQVLSLLMFFMSGRIIVSLVTHIKKINKLPIHTRAQPLLEGWTMALFMLSIALRSISMGINTNGFQMMLITNHVLLAVLIVTRIWRWAPFNIMSKNHALLGLMTAYLWLALSQLVIACDIYQHQTDISSLHLITVGALGLNSSIIMTLAVSKKRIVPESIFTTYLITVSAATACRFFSGVLPNDNLTLLMISATLWSLNYLVVLSQINHSPTRAIKTYN